MTVVAPSALEDALEALAGNPDLAVLGGGTDFMVEVNYGHRRPAAVLSLHAVTELRTWANRGAEVFIGSGVTCATLEGEPFASEVPALAQAARTVGSPQIRSAATIGGNLGTASPAGDLLPVLSALDARVCCARVGSTRDVSIHDFLIGPKRNALETAEMITGVLVPLFSGPQEFLKAGTRNAMVIAVANIALVAGHDDVGRADIRVALGSVGPTIIRARSAETWFAETGFDPFAATEFGQRVASEARPIDDHRSTAEYRSHAIGVMAKRAVKRMYGAAA